MIWHSGELLKSNIILWKFLRQYVYCSVKKVSKSRLITQDIDGCFLLHVILVKPM